MFFAIIFLFIAFYSFELFYFVSIGKETWQREAQQQRQKTTTTRLFCPLIDFIR